jgi:polysaccharide pyruvyl transferase WcaK-like protein
MRGILALVNDFAVRDESSLRNCRRAGSKAYLRLTADLVFSLPLSSMPKAGAERRRPVVGITLAASDFDNYLDQRGFLEQLAIALELLTKDSWSICFLAFQELSLEGSVVSDTALFERTRSLCPSLECSVIRMSANSADIADVYGQIDVVAGMRFHGHVLAAMLGLPFVGFGRDEKLEDLCSYMLMPFLNMENLVADRLASDIKRVRGMESDAKCLRGLSRQSIDNFTKIGASLL